MPRWLIILTAAAGLCGCHAAPRLDVQRVRLTDETPAGYALEFDLEATNTNEFELPLLTINYDLFLDGERVFEGRRSGEATLRREGAQTLTLPAAIPLAEGETAPSGVVDYRLRGTMRYLTPGALARSLFDARLSRPKVIFDHRGQIEFDDQGTGPDGDPG
ncbi:MAG: LEA type 2 family protein [Phycisphaerales bacterium JB039]